MSAFRPLPPSPSLEFEKKEAKVLLRSLRAGDRAALERVRAVNPRISDAPKLADVQFVLAREYGFTSWPRLARYFEDLEHQRRSPQGMRLNYVPDNSRNEKQVSRLLAAHQARRPWAGRSVVAYVPRYYCKPMSEVFDLALTEDEARLAVARQIGFVSWDDLLTRGIPAAAAIHRRMTGEQRPIQAAVLAMDALNLPALQEVAVAHPDLLHPTDFEFSPRNGNLMFSALAAERRHGRDEMRPIMDWLEQQGFDRQQALNFQLCGRMGMKPELVRELLDQGADPNWVAPNGIPVLEHAIIRYWAPEAVDELARHAKPRKALWIAAGLGDVEGVRSFLDHKGRPKPPARRLRPPFDLVGQAPLASHPEPDDEEILVESFAVAMINHRTTVLEYMASRGTPVNSLIYGNPLMHMAIGNAWTPVVECLVRCGADLDLPGEHPKQSAREMAREWFEGMPQDATRRRIVEICGMNPEEILAERRARDEIPPQ